jgi:hypothetical protein
LHIYKPFSSFVGIIQQPTGGGVCQLEEVTRQEYNQSAAQDWKQGTNKRAEPILASALCPAECEKLNAGGKTVPFCKSI